MLPMQQPSIDKLREHGVKATPQRQVILEYMESVHTHPRAEDVYTHVRQIFPGISLATVYNTLNTLVECGLLKQLSFGDGSNRFDARTDDHYHVVCERCGRVDDYARQPVAGLEEEAARDTGYQIRKHQVEFYGICRDCATGGK